MDDEEEKERTIRRMRGWVDSKEKGRERNRFGERTDEQDEYMKIKEIRKKWKENWKITPSVKMTLQIKCPLISGIEKRRKNRRTETRGRRKNGKESTVEEEHELETICFCHFLARSIR